MNKRTSKDVNRTLSQIKYAQKWAKQYNMTKDRLSPPMIKALGFFTDDSTLGKLSQDAISKATLKALLKRGFVSQRSPRRITLKGLKALTTSLKSTETI